VSEPTRPIVRFSATEGAAQSRDELAIEEPLEIRVRGRAISVTMRTPGNDDELAAGFLLGEGMIRRRDDLLKIEPCLQNDADNVVNVLLAPDIAIDFDKLTRHVFASSSCGLCGKTSIDAVRSNFSKIESDMTIAADTLLSLPQRMRDSQQTFARTGGLHAAAIFSASGDLLVLREDIGRHNAVDKAVGRCLLDAIALDRHVLLISGRASFEILQKALAARIPIVAAVSAPSSLAVDFATESGQTLVGFLREGRMNVYAHPHRLRLDPGAGPAPSPHAGSSG
jgi:FdhD protein